MLPGYLSPILHGNVLKLCAPTSKFKVQQTISPNRASRVKEPDTQIDVYQSDPQTRRLFDLFPLQFITVPEMEYYLAANIIHQPSIIHPFSHPPAIYQTPTIYPFSYLSSHPPFIYPSFIHLSIHHASISLPSIHHPSTIHPSFIHLSTIHPSTYPCIYPGSVDRSRI